MTRLPRANLPVYLAVDTTLRPFDAVSRSHALTLDFVVRVEDSAAAIVVEDGEEANCPEALARHRLENAVKRAFLERVCKARGRYVFSNGRFVRAR